MSSTNGRAAFHAIAAAADTPVVVSSSSEVSVATAAAVTVVLVVVLVTATAAAGAIVAAKSATAPTRWPCGCGCGGGSDEEESAAPCSFSSGRAVEGGCCSCGAVALSRSPRGGAAFRLPFASSSFSVVSIAGASSFFPGSAMERGAAAVAVSSPTAVVVVTAGIIVIEKSSGASTEGEVVVIVVVVVLSVGAVVLVRYQCKSKWKTKISKRRTGKIWSRIWTISWNENRKMSVAKTTTTRRLRT